jgi:hypothetical protein
LNLNSDHYKINKILTIRIGIIGKTLNLALLIDISLFLLYNIKLFRYIAFTLLGD